MSDSNINDPAAISAMLQQMIVNQDILNQLVNTQQPQQPPPVYSANIQMPDIAVYEHVEGGDGNKGGGDSNFEEWLDRFEYTLDFMAPNIDPITKVKLLMTKLSPAAYGEYKRSCLPDDVTKFDYDETKKRLLKHFGKVKSLHSDRIACLKATRKQGEDFTSFVNRLKDLFRKFRWSELNEEQFKCLILLTSLKSQSQQEQLLRQRILSKLSAEEESISFESVLAELNIMLSTVKEASNIIREPVESAKKKNPKNQQQNVTLNDIPIGSSGLVVENVQVPSKLAGWVIGEKWCNLNRIMEATKTNISTSKTQQDLQIFTITGPQEGVSMARLEIAKCLLNTPSSSSQSGTGSSSNIVINNVQTAHPPYRHRNKPGANATASANVTVNNIRQPPATDKSKKNQKPNKN